MTDGQDQADVIAAAVAAADGYFAKALCSIVREGREAGRINPEKLALEVEFALRGCYFQSDPVTDSALRERAAALLEAAGGSTRMEIEYGTLPAAGSSGGAKKLPFG